MNLRKNIWQFVIIGLIVALALSIYADFGAIIRSFRSFDWWLFPVVLGLTLTNQFLRFLKWEYLLGYVGVELNTLVSLQIFGSGLIMIMTPGKIGEIWKSWLVRDVEGVPISSTMPVVATERITDFLGVMTFGLMGVIIFDYSPVVLLAVVTPVITGIVILQNESMCFWVLERVEGFPFLNRKADDIRNLYEGTQELLQFRPLAVTTSLSVFSWGMECAGLWIVLQGFGSDVTFLAAAFVFALSSILGAVSLLPGGLGITDGSMTGLLLLFDVERTIAVSSTLITRAATLWFSAGLALLAYAIFRHQHSIKFQYFTK